MKKEILQKKVAAMQQSLKFINFLLDNKEQICIVDITFTDANLYKIRVPQTVQIANYNTQDFTDNQQQFKANIDTTLYKYKLQLQYALNQTLHILKQL